MHCHLVTTVTVIMMPLGALNIILISYISGNETILYDIVVEVQKEVQLFRKLPQHVQLCTYVATP